jgi:hypothetical protein
MTAERFFPRGLPCALNAAAEAESRERSRLLENRSPFTRTVGSNPTPSAPTADVWLCRLLRGSSALEAATG